MGKINKNMACKYVDNLTGITYDSKEELLDAIKGRNKNTIEYLETVLKSVQIDYDGKRYFSSDGSKRTYYKRVTEVIQTTMADMFDPELKYDTDKYIETEVKSFDARKKSGDPELVSFSTAKEYQEYLEKRVKTFASIAEGGTQTHKILEYIVNYNVKTIEELKDFPELSTAISWFANDDALQEFLDIGLKFKEDLDIRYRDIKYKIITENRVFDAQSGIAGTTDILILKEVDGVAKVDILDFKFSIKDAENWSRAKQKTVMYQQHMYRNIIRNMGISVDDMLIFPFTFSVDYDNKKITRVIDNPIQIINNIEHSTISENVNQIVKNNITVTVEGLKSNEDIYEFMEVFFNQTKEEIKESKVDEETVNRFAEKALKRGYWYNSLALPGEDKKVVYQGTEPEKERIRRYLVRMAEYRKNLSKGITKFIEQTRRLKEAGSDDIAQIPGTLSKYESDEIVKKNLVDGLKFLWEDYTLDKNGNRTYLWEIIESKEAQDLDLLFVRRRNEIDGSNEVRVISISNKDFKEPIHLNLAEKTKVLGTTVIDTGGSIAGNFFNKNKESEMGLLRANEGNIELLKAALFVLQNDKIFDGTYKISGLYAVSERSEPVYMPMEVAVDNLKKLVTETSKLRGFNPPKLASFMLEKNRLFPELYRTDPIVGLIEYYSMLVTKGLENTQLNIYRNRSKTIKSIYSNPIHDIKIKETLLRKFLEDRQKDLLSSKEKLTTWERDELKIVSEALLNLNGFSDCYEELDLGKTMKEMETADNVLKKPFRIIRELYSRARNNLVERMKILTRSSQEKFKNLYKRHGIIETDIIGLHQKAFSNLFEYVLVDGKPKKTMRFRKINDPNYNYSAFGQTSLTKEEKDVLQMFYDMKKEILAQKYKGENATDEQIRDIPLVYRKDLSYLIKQLKQKGLKDTVKDRLNLIVEDALNQENIALDSEELKDRLRVSDLFRYQESDSHRDILLQNDPEMFEDDVEFLYYLYAYQNYKSLEYNKVMPAMLAAKTLVNLSTHYWFKRFPNLNDLIEKYFVGAVFGQKVINEDLKETAEWTHKIKNSVSTLLQGVSPGSGIIQFLTSLWGVISASIGKYSDRVSFKSLKKATELLIGQQSLSFNNINFINYLDEDYRVTGLEPENLLYHFGETNKGIFSKRGALFNSRWVMWFTTAPDRAFRMLWFLAENIEKGVIKVDNFGISKDSALQWNEEKKTIEYRPELDDRFKDYFHKGKNYEEHKALYELFIKDLKEEVGGYSDKPLKAWTERETRAMRKIAGSIFADMSEETKSSWERSIFGILFTHFKRWIYGKRELYWKTNKPDEESGHWEIAKDKDGNLMKTPDGDYVRVWVGRQQEGILNTLWFITKELAYYKNLSALKQLEPYQMKNLKHLASDVILLCLIMAITKGLFDDEDDRNAFTKTIMRYLYNSGKDILFVNTMWNLGTENSTFVTISVLDRLIRDVIGNALTGEFDSAGKALFTTIGVTRLPYQIYQFSQ